MTPKSFVYLAAAAVVSALLAVVTFAANNQWSTGKAAGDKLVPALADSIRQVAAIEIRQGEQSAVLERAANGSWSLKSRGGYPVDVTKVRALLVGLSEAELAERKTGKADRYAVLELEDPADKGAKSRLVRLLTADGNAIAETVLGKKRQEGYGPGRSAGTYVRRHGDPQTWLTSVELDAPVATKDWVKTGVLALDSARISRVSIEIPGEQALKIERPAPAAPKEPKEAKDVKQNGKDTKGPEKADQKAAPAVEPGKLAFVGFPAEGKKLKDASAAESLARAVSSIDLEDVRKLAASPAGEGMSVVKVESGDGLVATLRLRKEGDAQWLSITAGGEGDAKKTAEEITARTQGWEFKVPAWKVEAILKKRPDLLEASGS